MGREICSFAGKKKKSEDKRCFPDRKKIWTNGFHIKDNIISIEVLEFQTDPSPLSMTDGPMENER
jgi:hypothetical protein